jgi:replicative DNA helicase
LRISNAEKAVLGAVVSEPDLINFKGVADLLPKHFNDDLAQELFETVKTKNYDLLAIADRIGGRLLDLAQTVAADYHSTANLHVYAEIITEDYEKRELHRTLSKAQQDVMDGEPVDRVKASLNNALSATSEARSRTIGEICRDVVENIEKRSESGGYLGLKTGFAALDNFWQGMEFGDLIILAARPAMGKTALALNIAQHVARENRCLIFSLEMPAEQLIERMTSSYSNLEADKIKNPSLMDDGDWTKLTAGITAANNYDMAIYDQSMTLDKLISTIRREAMSKKPELIIIDYLQLITAKAESRVVEITKISGALKSIAKEIGCPVLALSQLSRKVEERQDKRPNNSDLRDSGSIEQDADKIAFIYRDEVYNDDSINKGIAEIITTKNRSGECGTAALETKLRYYKFTETNRVPQREVKKITRGFNG